MICPDRSAWRAKLAHRYDAGLAEPAQWPLERAHLETCAECRQRALEVDPTLLFQRLSGAGTASDVETMRAAVNGLRHARALTAPAEANRSTRRRQAIWRWAAAAALVLGLGTQLPLRPVRTASALAIAPQAPAGVSLVASTMVRASDDELGGLPQIENASRPDARVYEFGDSKLAVVMIVDQSLDL